MSASSFNKSIPLVDLTHEVDTEQYGNFHLRIENLDDLFSTDDNQNHKKDHDLQINHVFARKTQSVIPFKKSNEPVLPKENRRNTKQDQMIVFSTEFILSKLLRLNFNEIPDYLSNTNQTFQTEIDSILPMTTNLEQLRSMAILMYKIIVIDMIDSLWKIYQKSAIGELEIKLPIDDKIIDRKVWPKEIQLLVKEYHLEEIQNKGNNIGLFLVDSCLHKLNEQSEEYRRELRFIASSVADYTPHLEDRMEKYVRQGLNCLRIEIDCQIALIYYDYIDELFQRQRIIENLDDGQIGLVQRLCQLKCRQEIARQEINLLKKIIPVHLSMHPFDSQSLVQSPMINSLRHPNLQQELYMQYKTVSEQARRNKLNLYMQSLEKQMEYWEKSWNSIMDKIWKTNQTLPRQHQFTSTMLNSIQQSFANMTARFECIYKFKMKLFDTKTNLHE